MRGLDDKELSVRLEAVEMIQYLREEDKDEKLYEKIKKAVMRGLDYESSGVRLETVEMIQYLREEDKDEKL